MVAYTLAKKRVFVCVILIILICGAISMSLRRKGEALKQMRKFAEDSAFSRYLDYKQKNPGKISKDINTRIAGYLGNTQEMDVLDGRPLVGDKDPDLEQVVEELTKEKSPELNENKSSRTSFVSIPTSKKFGSQSVASGSYTKATFSPDMRSEPSSQSEEDETGRFLESPSKNPSISGSDATSRLKPSNFAGIAGLSNIGTIIEPEAVYVPEPSRLNSEGKLQFRLYSHNIRTGANHKMTPGEKPWDQRKRHVINSIKANVGQFTIVCLQEAQRFQIDDIMNDLNIMSTDDDPEWVYYGRGRVDGLDKGEHVPIIYRPSEWTIIFNDTFWLNDGRTRSAMSGWDGRSLRIASLVTLQSKTSKHFLNIVNTQFDEKGVVARKESATLLASKLESINNWPSFLVGDLNALPDDPFYGKLTEHFVDIHDYTPDFNKYGHPDYSVTGFSGKYLRDAKRIDYIFAPKYTQKLSSPNCKASDNRPFSLHVLGYGLLHSKYGGMYMSNHRPLIADFSISGCSKKPTYF